ncbi:MAG: hypothetical protein R3Y57_00595 [Erysipelotrichaceae bacterium]
MKYETIKRSFALKDDQRELFCEILETLEFDDEDIEIAMQLAEEELAMNILLSTLASFSFYENVEDIDEEYADTILNSIGFIIESVKDMDRFMNEDGELVIPEGFALN